MGEGRLKIVENLSQKELYIREKRAYFNQKWQEPKEPTAVDRKIAHKKHHLLKNVTATSIADIGCGDDPYPDSIAIDVATVLAERFPHIQFGCLPYLKLPDSSYDLVIATDVIAELDEKLYRLALSELARIVTAQGKVLLSSYIDPKSDAIERFLELIQTEFEIDEMIPSYHRWGVYFEKISKIIFGLGGITHIFVWAHKRSLVPKH